MLFLLLECCLTPHYFTVYMLLTQHKMLRSAQGRRERERERDACHDLHFKGTNSNVDAVWMLRECALQMAPYKHIPNVAQIDQQACKKEKQRERDQLQ